MSSSRGVSEPKEGGKHRSSGGKPSPKAETKWGQGGGDELTGPKKHKYNP